MFLSKTLFSLTLLVSSMAAAAPAVDKVSVGVSPTTSTAGVFVAQEMGFFKAENLEVELQVFAASTAPMMPLLAKGELDVGGGNITAGLFTANAAGAEVVLVADKGSVRKNADYLKLMVRTDLVTSGRYKSYKDLKGFKFGVTALGGTSQEASIARFLAKGGLKPSDVEFVKVGYADASKSFTAKAIDAYIQLEPYVAELEKAGVAKVIEGLYAVHPGQQSAAIFYSPKFAKERGDVAVRFMKAYIRGCRTYNDAFLKGDRKGKMFADVVGVLTKWTNVKDAAIYQTMVPAGLDPDGHLNVAALKEDVAYFKAQKYLTAEPKWSDVVQTSFVDKALVLLKK